MNVTDLDNGKDVNDVINVINVFWDDQCIYDTCYLFNSY